jgi:hypothetical protein
MAISQAFLDNIAWLEPTPTFKLQAWTVCSEKYRDTSARTGSGSHGDIRGMGGIRKMTRELPRLSRVGPIWASWEKCQTMPSPSNVDRLQCQLDQGSLAIRALQTSIFSSLGSQADPGAAPAGVTLPEHLGRVKRLQ